MGVSPKFFFLGGGLFTNLIGPSQEKNKNFGSSRKSKFLSEDVVPPFRLSTCGKSAHARSGRFVVRVYFKWNIPFALEGHNLLSCYFRELDGSEAK
jgi:hypothetical protein